MFMLASTHKIIAKTSPELSAGFLHSVHGSEERDPGEEWHRAPNEAGQGQVQVPNRPLIQLHGLYSELLVYYLIPFHHAIQLCGRGSVEVGFNQPLTHLFAQFYLNWL